MSGNDEDMKAIALTAAQWVVRGQGPDVRETDIVALTEWLEASDAHVDAYRHALEIWMSIERQADDSSVAEYSVADTEVSNVVHWHRVQPSAQRTAPRRALVWGAGAAIAASLAALLALPLVLEKPAPIVTYQTVKGQRQSVTLADGTLLMLNTDTLLTVQLRKGERVLKLDHGEVALHVTHDATRPFQLDTGDMRITDVGTEFNVLRQDTAVRVTVKEGAINLQPLSAQGNANAMILHAGDLGVHRDGALASTVSRVNPDEAFAWQTAHAIYRDQPLSAVVKDLNRYFDKPIIVDEETGKLRLTAILTLDSEGDVVARLGEFLSLDARATDQGIVLSRGGDHGRKS